MLQYGKPSAMTLCEAGIRGDSDGMAFRPLVFGVI